MGFNNSLTPEQMLALARKYLESPEMRETFGTVAGEEFLRQLAASQPFDVPIQPYNPSSIDLGVRYVVVNRKFYLWHEVAAIFEKWEKIYLKSAHYKTGIKFKVSPYYQQAKEDVEKHLQPQEISGAKRKELGTICILR